MGKRRNNAGFTLLEALIAMAITGIVLAGLVPSFVSFLDANSMSEQRSNAVAAAQEVMETLRQQDPGAMPSSGSSGVQAIEVGQHEYEVEVMFCSVASYCSAASRHILLEVSFAGESIYEVETIYTRLR